MTKFPSGSVPKATKTLATREPVIVCAAITGGAPARSKSPYHPCTPTALIDEALACWRAGAAMIHLHARLEDGSTTSDVSAYTHLRNTIREAGCDALLSFSAGDDGGRASHDQRLAIPEAGGDFSSLSGGSFNIGDRQYDNPPSYLREMAIRLRRSGVMPEIEIFDSGQLHGVHALINEGMIDPPFCIQFVFGVPGGMPIDERLLPILVENLPAGAHWMVSCQTSDPLVHARFMREAAAAGGHLRTGIEDIVFVAPGDYACSNVALVEQCTGYALSAGRSVATSEEARRKVGKPAMPAFRRVSS